MLQLVDVVLNMPDSLEEIQVLRSAESCLKLDHQWLPSLFFMPEL